MTFDEWFHKEYEPADLQIKQYAERKEGLRIPATVYLEDLKKAFEAGMKVDVHTDNSKVIAELEKENAELKLKLEALEGQTPWKDIKDKSEVVGKLTKAKEHIENLLYYVKQCTCERSNYAEIEEDIKQAERFISEVEK